MAAKEQNEMDRRYFAAAVLAASALVWVEGRTVHADGTTLFIRSALEHGDGTVTLPLYRGTSRGRTVWYVVLDASSSNDADRFGVNRAQKLANARGTLAVQQVTVRGGIVDFPATVDFSP